jgi:GT2 family glycosyltransferase
LLLYPDGRPWPIAFRFPTIWSEIDEGVNWGLVTKLLNRWVVSREMGDRPERVDWLPGASMMIRRSVIDQLGGLDEAYFLYFEEVDFMLKLARAGWETWFVPQSRVYHIAGVSSGITGEEREHRPLPDYWFESRRRFFAKNHGVPYAIATDVVAFTARLLGHAKRTVQRAPGSSVPGYVLGLLRNSVVFGKNQRVAESVEFRPKA